MFLSPYLGPKKQAAGVYISRYIFYTLDINFDNPSPLCDEGAGGGKEGAGEWEEAGQKVGREERAE